MTEDNRKDFCVWYYAQQQPLDANKIFEWFLYGIDEKTQPATTISEGVVLVKKETLMMEVMEQNILRNMQKIIDNLQAILDSIEFVEKEQGGVYIISEADKKLLLVTLATAIEIDLKLLPIETIINALRERYQFQSSGDAFMIMRLIDHIKRD